MGEPSKKYVESYPDPGPTPPRPPDDSNLGMVWDVEAVAYNHHIRALRKHLVAKLLDSLLEKREALRKASKDPSSLDYLKKESETDTLLVVLALSHLEERHVLFEDLLSPS